MNLHRRVVVAVIEQAGGSPASKRELLEMLGVIDTEGRITPVDSRPNIVESLNNGLPVDRLLTRRGEERRPDNCTTPPGLLNLPPVETVTAVQPVPDTEAKPKRKPRSVTGGAVKPRGPNAGGCGSPGGRMRHIRAGEPVCQKCKDAHTIATREYRARRAAAGFVRDRTRDRTSEYRRVNPDLPPRPETCGSLAGRSNHLRRGENLCQKCATFYTNHCHTRDQQKATETGEERSA